MKIYKLFFLTLFLSVSIVETTLAQDYHFSQFYSTPLSLNPALTGRFAEDYRVSAIHRNQWKSIQSSFQTTALGLDFNLKGGFLNHDKIGIGLLFYKDQMPNNTMTNTSFQLSGAYHTILDAHKRHSLSFGVQGGFNQRSINLNDGKYGNQYNNYVYDPNLNSGEQFSTDQHSYSDIQFGVMYGFALTRKDILEGGISVYQLLTPEASSIETANVKDEIGTRYVLNLGSNHELNHKISIHPRVLYMNQSKSSDFNLGAYMGYKIGHQLDYTVFAGGFYRTSDAAIGLIGLGYKKLEVKFSYDFTTSQLNDVKGATGTDNASQVGAWEISLIFKGILKRGVPTDYTVPCGIF